MLRVPSLKPIMLRGVCASGVVEDVLPKPSWDQRIATLPKPIRARLRIACTATCGSSAHACTHRSPPLRAGSRLSPGKCGQVDQRLGPPVREAEPVLALLVEEGGAEADREGEPGRLEAERLAGVVRRRLGEAADRAVADRVPLRSSAAAAASTPSAARSSSARSSVVTSKAAKCSRSWTAVAMPGLVRRRGTATAAPPSARPARRRRRCRIAAAVPPAAAAPSASPAPPQPSSARREGAVRGRRLVSVHHRAHCIGVPHFDLCDGRGELGQRLGQRVDRVRQLLAVVLGDRVVGDEAVALVAVARRAACAPRRTACPAPWRAPGRSSAATGLSSSYDFSAPSTLALKSTRSVWL